MNQKKTGRAIREKACLLERRAAKIFFPKNPSGVGTVTDCAARAKFLRMHPAFFPDPLFAQSASSLSNRHGRRSRQFRNAAPGYLRFGAGGSFPPNKKRAARPFQTHFR